MDMAEYATIAIILFIICAALVVVLWIKEKE
jgi:hypothetical protein